MSIKIKGKEERKKKKNCTWISQVEGWSREVEALLNLERSQQYYIGIGRIWSRTKQDLLHKISQDVGELPALERLRGSLFYSSSYESDSRGHQERKVSYFFFRHCTVTSTIILISASCRQIPEEKKNLQVVDASNSQKKTQRISNYIGTKKIFFLFSDLREKKHNLKAGSTLQCYISYQ